MNKSVKISYESIDNFQNIKTKLNDALNQITELEKHVEEFKKFASNIQDVKDQIKRIEKERHQSS